MREHAVFLAGEVDRMLAQGGSVANARREQIRRGRRIFKIL